MLLHLLTREIKINLNRIYSNNPFITGIKYINIMLNLQKRNIIIIIF